MATFSKIDGAEPSTVTFSLATVTQDRNGVTAHQEIVTLGGSESTLAIAQVRAAAPASTDYGLVVRVADPSTGPFVISSIVGPVNMRSSKADALVTVYQSSAADLNVTVAGYVAPSTIVTVSTGSVRVHQSSAADLNVTVAGYSTTINVSSLAGAVITRSSKADMLVSVYQSSAADLNVTVAGYVAPSTTVAVSTVQGRVAIAGFHAVNGIINVTDSTNNAINVNVVAGSAAGSTTVNVSSLAGAVITRSSKADMLVTVYQSSAADFNVTVAGYSTTINISSLAGPVICRSSKADALVSVYQSSAAELQVTLGAIASAFQSTTAPAPGSSALIVREALQDLLSTRAVITSSNSTALYTLVSSVAALKHKVYAYSITSTETTPSTIVFMSSNVIDRWAVAIGSGSSGVTGANLALSPPGYIFRTDAANALRCLIEKGASTQCIVTLSIAYFSEP